MERFERRQATARRRFRASSSICFESFPFLTLPRHGLALRELARLAALRQLHQAEQEVRGEKLEVERQRERENASERGAIIA